MKKISITLLSLVLSNALMADGAVLNEFANREDLAKIIVDLQANTPSSKIKQKLSAKLVNTHIDKVVPSVEIPSLYEIHMGPNIFFADENADYIMIGHIFDLNGTDLTQVKIAPKMEAYQAQAQANQMKAEEESRLRIESLRKDIDLSKALKIGKGKHEVIVFTNTECHFCRDSETMIKDGDMTKYVFFTTYLAPQLSKPKSVHILCAKDPAKEYAKVMRGELDNVKLNSCQKGEERLDGMMGIAKKLGGFGTPLFFIDGKVVNGANPIIQTLVK